MWEPPAPLLFGLSVIGFLMWVCVVALFLWRLMGFDRPDKPDPCCLPKDQLIPTTTFDDLLGHDALKTRLLEIIGVLKQFPGDNNFLPKILISGGSETGKTTWAQALAGTARIPLLAVPRQMLLARDREGLEKFFERALELQPVLILIDHIDDVLDDDPESAQMREAIYGFCRSLSGSERVILVAIVNGTLNPQHRFVAPGYFDCVIRLQGPHFQLRRDFLRKRVKEVFPIAAGHLTDQCYSELAQWTWGCSYAFLERLVQHVITLPVKGNSPFAVRAVFEDSLEELQMGVNCHDPASFSVAERERIALHEAGHAVMCYLVNPGWLTFRLRIDYYGNVCRGGYHYAVPPAGQEIAIRSRRLIVDRVRHSMAAWVAEQLIYGDTADGVGGDLQRLTSEVRDMVMEHGMSEQLGPVYLPEGQEGLAKEAILEIIATERDWVREALEKNREMLLAVRDALLADSCLNHDDFMAVVAQFEIQLPTKEA